MKWCNKGHEFDAAFESMAEKNGYYLFGAGHDGKMVFDIVRQHFPEICIFGFIDNDSNKIGKEYCGVRVYRPEDVDFHGRNAGIIISIGADFQADKEEQLSQLGLVKNRDYFHYYVFLMVYAAYRKKQIFLPNVNFIPGTYCNLNCRACLNFKPYIKKFYSKSLEDCKTDIDIFFSIIDYVGLFCITGGEPFLYPHLGGLISYIAEKYGSRIYSLETITNGTVLPGDEFLSSYTSHNVLLTVDDYRDQLPQTAGTFDQVIAALDECHGKGRYVIKKYDNWIQLYPSSQAENLNEEALCRKYDSCHIPWQNYSEGKLYSCNYAKYAADAGIGPGPEEGEYLDLQKLDRQDAKIIIEFRSGYTGKGYVGFCRKCGGYMDINNHHVPAAQQEET